MLIRGVTFFAVALWVSAAQASEGRTVVIDARPLSVCERGSVPEARCLPAEDFFGPDGRLANFRDILWLLGTAGLDGSESVAVRGEGDNAKHVVAAILFLAGQRSVTVVAGGDALPVLPGRRRGVTREKVYQAAMRDDRIVLPHELSRYQTGAVITAAEDRRALVQFALAYRQDDALQVLLGGVGGSQASWRSWWWWLMAVAVVVTAGLFRWRKARCNCCS